MTHFFCYVHRWCYVPGLPDAVYDGCLGYFSTHTKTIPECYVRSMAVLDAAAEEQGNAMIAGVGRRSVNSDYLEELGTDHTIVFYDVNEVDNDQAFSSLRPITTPMRAVT